MDPQQFQCKLEGLVKAHGIDLFGVADLTTAEEFLAKQCGTLASRYPLAISLGLGLPHSIIDALATRDPAVMATYNNIYTTVNHTLDRIALLVARFCEDAGYHSLPIPASQTLPGGDYRGLVSHKLAAHLAGLGWVGRSCLLITPQFGPRVRFATILTTAPLAGTTHVGESGCGDCTACVEICPANALTGKPFAMQDDRSARFNPHLCRGYTDQYQQHLGFQFPSSSTVCGLCVHICPHGRGGPAFRQEKRGSLANN